MRKPIAICFFFWFWACMIVHAQTRHLTCMDVPIDGTISEMEQKFYDCRGGFTTIAEDWTLHGRYYDKNAYVKLLGSDDRIWGVQLEIDTVLSTKEEARQLQEQYETRFKKRYWSLFMNGVLSYYDAKVEEWGISDSHYCTIRTSRGVVIGQIFVFIMRYYGDNSKYQVYITYVDEQNRAVSTDHHIVQRTSPAVSDDTGDVLSIREAMDIVAFRRHYPLADGKAKDRFIVSALQKHHYIAADFLEGVGTCSFWQYIKHGRAKFDMTADDAFVPNNIALASNVAVTDCDGIETIENDETSIDVDIRVYGEKQKDMLLQEMKDIGFVHTKTDEYGKEYAWKSYVIKVGTASSRGYKYWWFNVSLELIDYASTRHYSFADTTGYYRYSIDVDFLVNESPVLIESVNSFMRRTFNSVHYPEEMLDGNDSYKWESLQDVIDHYGKKGVERLKELEDGVPHYVEESLSIKRIAETDQYITFEVNWWGYYGGVLNALQYGATFRKVDGKRIRIIESPESRQFKLFLNKEIMAYLDKDMMFDVYKNDLPFPQYEPYLIQTGVRFVYQKYEITAGAGGVPQVDVSFYEIKDYMTSEVKELLRNNNIE